MKSNRSFLAILLILCTFLLIFCDNKGQKPSEKKKLNIVTTLFPIYDFTRNITGEKADVKLLLPPGIEAHSFDPKPSDIRRINSADILIFTGKYMEPWVEGVLKGIENRHFIVVDASKGIALAKSEAYGDEHGHKKGKNTEHIHGKIDPHIWLDITNAKTMIDNILEGIIQKDETNRDYYVKNATVYKVKLDEMDKRYMDSLTSCKKKVFIHGGHFAFGYLARRYGLIYLAAYKGSPDSEPTPTRMAELKKTIKNNNLQYIYYEELITPRVAEIIAKEAKIKTLKLHGAHNISKEEMDSGITYLKIMEKNLDNLRLGLECNQ